MAAWRLALLLLAVVEAVVLVAAAAAAGLPPAAARGVVWSAVAMGQLVMARAAQAAVVPTVALAAHLAP